MIATSSVSRPGRRPGSSRERIVQCAIRMLGRDGPEALTFRAVARELDITVGALSRYFKNLADLQDEVAARLIADLPALDAGGKSGFREQLARLGMDWLELNRQHPYLVTIHGPASASALARHIGHVVKVMVKAGIDFDRAMVLYSMVVNLAYSWGVQYSRQLNPELQATIMKAFAEEIGELAPRIAKLTAAATGTAFYHNSFLLLIDGLIPANTSAAAARKKR